MRSDSEMPMVEDVCRLQWLDARTCPIVSVALVRAHLPWWQQLIHRFHVWQRNEFQLQIILTISMHRVDIVIYRNKCKIYSKTEKRAFCFYCDHNGDLAWIFKWARTEHLHLCVVLLGHDLHFVPTKVGAVRCVGSFRWRSALLVETRSPGFNFYDPDVFWWGKRPSFWVRSERWPSAGKRALQSEDRGSALQVAVSSPAWPALPWPVVAALESG